MKYVKYVGEGGGACSFEKLHDDIQGLNQQSIHRLTKLEE